MLQGVFQLTDPTCQTEPGRRTSPHSSRTHRLIKAKTERTSSGEEERRRDGDDFRLCKGKKRADLMNEGSVSLQVPRACRVIRLKLGAGSDGLTDKTQLKEKNSVSVLHLNPPQVKKKK